MRLAELLHIKRCCICNVYSLNREGTNMEKSCSILSNPTQLNTLVIVWQEPGFPRISLLSGHLLQSSIFQDASPAGLRVCVCTCVCLYGTQHVLPLSHCWWQDEALTQFYRACFKWSVCMCAGLVAIHQTDCSQTLFLDSRDGSVNQSHTEQMHREINFNLIMYADFCINHCKNMLME